MVCGLSAQQLYVGVKGNLLQESLCRMLRDACLLQAVPLPPCQATHASTGDTQTLKIEDYILESQAEIFSWDDDI